MPLLPRRNRGSADSGETNEGAAAAPQKKLKVLVLLGSVRDGRMGERVGKYVVEKLKENGHDVDLADPEKLDLPLLKNPFHFYPEKKAPKHVKEFNEMVANADAFVVVTAEYNRIMPPALINMMDHAAPISFSFKTSGIISYSMGPGGGSTAHYQARSYLAEFGAPPIPYMFTIGEVQNALDAEGKASDEKLDLKMGKFLKQFNWFGAALKIQRETTPIAWEGPVASV